MTVRKTYRVDRYRLISFVPTDEYWAWYKDDDGSLFCVKVDGIGVARWWSVIIEHVTGIKLASEYVCERVVGVYSDNEDGSLFPHEAANYVGLYKTGIVPAIEQEQQS